MTSVKANLVLWAGLLALGAACSSSAHEHDAAGLGETGPSRQPDALVGDAGLLAQDGLSPDSTPPREPDAQPGAVDLAVSPPSDAAIEDAAGSDDVLVPPDLPQQPDLAEPDVPQPLPGAEDAAPAPGLPDATWSAERPSAPDHPQVPEVSSSPPVVSSTSVSPTTGTPCTARQLSVEVAGGEGTPTASWDFADGTTATGLSVSHRFLTPGTKTVTVSVTDSVGRVATSTVSVTIAPVSRDVRLRFRIKASVPDALDYIRRVELDATSIGVPGMVLMRDDGIAGGDAVAGDGIYGAEAFVASCEDLQTPVQIKVQGASGVSKTLSVVPADYQ